MSTPPRPETIPAADPAFRRTADTPAPSDPARPGAASPDGPARPARLGYLGLWRATPRTLGLLLLTLPFAAVSFSVSITLVAAGAGLLVVVLGAPILVAALLCARWFGDRWAGLASNAVGRPITRPRPAPAPQPGTPLGRRLRSGLSSRSDWRALLHSALVHFPLSCVLFTLGVVWTAMAVAGSTSWLWNSLIPDEARGERLSSVLHESAPWLPLPADPGTADSVLYTVTGLIFLVTLPLVLRGLALIDWHIARALLGQTQGDRLRADVAQLEAARGQAASAEHRTLGQLERDLHDGPQQQLIRLQMDLASAQRRLAKDPEAAASLLAEARSTAASALGDLRALSRGVAPPLLADRGLRAALDSMADNAPLPTSVIWEIGQDVHLSEVTERTLYFIASESLTNAAKHSGADSVKLRLSERSGLVSLEASDSGRGGACLVPGHGLAGLAQRAQGVGGSLTVSSPEGGPTVLTASVPVSLGA